MLAPGFPDALLANLIDIGFITTESRAIRAAHGRSLMRRAGPTRGLGLSVFQRALL
jgi:hypothetical protein